MSTDYNYDEQGQFFPFFILTLTGLVTLPLSYTLLRPSKELENTAPRIKSDYSPPHADLVEGQKRKQRRKERRLKRIVTVLVGYLVMGYMVYLIIVTARAIPKIWDPYDILGISRSLSEEAIKKHYRKLSLKFHPDKIRPDPAKNETIESLNEYFVDLTKAYKALTDEEIRNNYAQYGHPDGKQSYSIGIALPKFIITDGNGKYVLLVYGVLLGVLLPYVVGKWWYGTQRTTKDGVLVASAGKLFGEYKEDIPEGGIVGALSVGEEYMEVLSGEKADKGSGKVEKKILEETEYAPKAGGLVLKDQEKLKAVDDAQRRKALALLWAYLGRVELDDPALNDEKFEVAPIARNLNDSFTAISLAFANIGPILSSYRTSQNLIQAIPPGWSSLLQLPYFTPKIVNALEPPHAKTHMTVQQFMRLPEGKRRSVIAPSLLTQSQYDTAISVAKQIPALVVAKAFFKVTGERVVTPSSLVQLVVKARVIPPGYPSTSIPEVNELDLEDIDPDEDDLDALLGRKPAKSTRAKNPDGSTQPPTPDSKPVQPPLAHAPYFARDHSPRWNVFLADSKPGKMAVPPFTFTTFQKPMFTDSGEPTFNIQTLKMQFQAPQQVGNFTFVMHLICDSYIGFDSKQEVTLVVEDLDKAMKMNEEDEISEPDEDSIAGQMAALKTGGLSAPPKKKVKKLGKKVEEEGGDSSEEESDTDGDVTDTSETDTETEDEGE